jgi:hypothetical protein
MPSTSQAAMAGSTMTTRPPPAARVKPVPGESRSSNDVLERPRRNVRTGLGQIRRTVLRFGYDQRLAAEQDCRNPAKVV